jgi:hypothetical protein
MELVPTNNISHLPADQPPKYVLDTDYIDAVPGESSVINFTVTAEPPLADDAKHFLTVETDGKPKRATRRFKIQKNCITLPNLRTSDSGIYVISCHNEAGEGQETFELEVTRAENRLPSTCDWDPSES